MIFTKTDLVTAKKNDFQGYFSDFESPDNIQIAYIYRLIR